MNTTYIIHSTPDTFPRLAGYTSGEFGELWDYVRLNWAHVMELTNKFITDN